VGSQNAARVAVRQRLYDGGLSKPGIAALSDRPDRSTERQKPPAAAKPADDSSNRSGTLTCSVDATGPATAFVSAQNETRGRHPSCGGPIIRSRAPWVLISP
jgi:hypothetical protein